MVLSSTIPETFEQLWVSLAEIIPFAICVTLITLIWYQHYIFFLKYGLQDKKTILLNTLLLFLLLVYVYPLKFLARFLTEIYGGLLGFFETDYSSFGEYSHQNLKWLMMTYGFGAFAIFMVIALMYFHALKRKEALKLTTYETYTTRKHVWANLIQCSIPLISFIFTWIDPSGDYITFVIGGFLYFLHIPSMVIFGHYTNKKANKILAE